MIKANYVYLAIGFGLSKPCNKLSLLCPLLRMQFYIGVRTGQLPDDSYKTSSKNSKWKYIAKVPLAIFSLRQEADENEVFVLKYFKEKGLWRILANKAIGKHYNNGGRTFVMPEATKQKLSDAGKGKIGYWRNKTRSQETKQKMSNSQKNIKRGPSPNKGKPQSEQAKINQRADIDKKAVIRLSKYGVIAMAHSKHGGILLADACCLLDFCKKIARKPSAIEKVLRGERKSVLGWSIIDYA